MSVPAERSPSSHDAARERTRAGVNDRLANVAERALERALVEQRRPMLGAYALASHAEDAAFEHAVREICVEAHRLDLRAEEVLVGVKQAWLRLASVRARHLGDRDADVLRRVVSSSIEVFFESRQSSDRERN